MAATALMQPLRTAQAGVPGASAPSTAQRLEFRCHALRMHPALRRVLQQQCIGRIHYIDDLNLQLTGACTEMQGYPCRVQPLNRLRQLIAPTAHFKQPHPQGLDALQGIPDAGARNAKLGRQVFSGMEHTIG